MKYIIFPTKDTTLYSHSESVNTGLDPILELIKDNVDVDAQTSQSSRIMLGFDWTTASESMAKIATFPTVLDQNKTKSIIKLYTVEANNIPYSYKLQAYTSRTPWEMGIGKWDHNPQTTKGASWDFTDTSGSTTWTASGGDADMNHTDSMTQSFEFQSTDISIDVSKSIALWEAKTSSSAQGIVLQFTASQEADSLEYGSLKFYSRDTNTIYSPRIEVSWQDHAFDTGSLSVLDTDEIMVYLKNNKYEYKEDELARFQVRCRDVNPSQTYGTTSAALQAYMLPTSSYYSIKDAETEETVIDFDAFTMLSCTGSGNYFDFHMSALTSERLYKLLIKAEGRNYNGQVEYFDSNHIFKVVR